MYTHAKSIQTEFKIADSKHLRDMSGPGKISTHNVSEPYAFRVEKNRASKTGIQKHGVNSAPAAQDSEVRRTNKLGYTRISVACEPCRRRKIRCILKDGDSQERCVTCIRLQKACAFHPPKRQDKYTGRFQIFDNIDPTVNTSTAGSLPLADHIMRSALSNVDQLENSPTSSSVASLSPIDSNMRPWTGLLNGLVSGTFGFDPGLAPLLGSHPGLEDDSSAFNQLHQLSYVDTMGPGDDFSPTTSLLNPQNLPPDVCAQIHNGYAAARLPPGYDVSASYPPRTMPFAQPYNATSQVEVPSSSLTAEQQNPWEPLQVEKSCCPTT